MMRCRWRIVVASVATALVLLAQTAKPTAGDWPDYNRDLAGTRYSPLNANPMTYEGKNGKQYVAVIATDTVRVFALP